MRLHKSHIFLPVFAALWTYGSGVNVLRVTGSGKPHACAARPGIGYAAATIGSRRWTS
jgi:hypothetical protein